MSSGVTPESIAWEVLPKPRKLIRQLEQGMSDMIAQQSRDGLKELLCDYFAAGECTSKNGSIAPMAGGPDGAKALKVRWALPGGGKSGGLRLAVVVFCDDRRVVLAGAYLRSKKPSNSDFANAFGDVEGGG